MSESLPPNPSAPPSHPFPPSPPIQAVLPPRLPPPAPPPPRSGNSLLGCFFSVSLLVNIVAGLILFIGCLGMFFVNNSNSDETSIGGGLLEKLHSGKSGSKDKIAIISLEGLILEGMLDYVHKQIEQAAKDKSVKAVVLLINSPGGSITASDELHRKLVELRDGNKEKKYPAKPLVVSMSSLAASGGYYVAMPASTIYAEEATLTGSIGVYVSLPNVTGLAKQYGFTMNTIKAGKIKDSGSAFAVMSDEEHQVWQDMINTAYNRFAEVVVEGRKDKLKREDLTAEFEVDAIPGPPGDTPRLKRYKRYRADGGIWTAHKAKELKLVDEIGTVDDAVLAVHKLAAIGQDYKVIQYEQKPKTLRELLLGAETSHPGLALDPTRLKNLLAPRVWMLMPGYDLQAMVSSLEAK